VKRLFLDANVLFTAAHNPDGKAALILELAGAGHWEALTSTYAVAEARRNLERKAPQRAPALRELLRNVRVVAATKGGGCLLPLPERPGRVRTAHHSPCLNLPHGRERPFYPTGQ